jgi:hypothetical protein
MQQMSSCTATHASQKRLLRWPGLQERLVASKEAKPCDDLLSRVIQSHLKSGQIRCGWI